MSATAPPGSAVELQSLLAALDRSTPAPYALSSELLAFLVAQHIHAPKLVVKYGKQLIVHYRGKLGDRGPRHNHSTQHTPRLRSPHPPAMDQRWSSSRLTLLMRCSICLLSTLQCGICTSACS